MWPTSHNTKLCPFLSLFPTWRASTDPQAFLSLLAGSHITHICKLARCIIGVAVVYRWQTQVVMEPAMPMWPGADLYSSMFQKVGTISCATARTQPMRLSAMEPIETWSNFITNPTEDFMRSGAKLPFTWASSICTGTGIHDPSKKYNSKIIKYYCFPFQY